MNDVKPNQRRDKNKPLGIRCQAMHLKRNSIAFNSFSAQEYFEKLLYCFVKEQTKGGAKTEYKARKQHAKEDVLEYYENKLNMLL